MRFGLLGLLELWADGPGVHADFARRGIIRANAVLFIVAESAGERVGLTEPKLEFKSCPNGVKSTNLIKRALLIGDQIK